MSGWFKTGTISVTNASATVTGSGTTWIANAEVGEALYAPDGRLYEITNIASDTSMTITPAYLGNTLSGQDYVIVPSQSYIRDLAAQAADLVNNYSTIANFAGQGKFGDGTLTAPGIRYSDDLDTGFFRSAANEVTFVAGGVAQFKYNASGVSFVTGGDLVGTTATQTLTNKTLTSPVINSPTGLVKADVGLGNVDNTSDATKNSATATLSNKTLTAPVVNTPNLTGGTINSATIGASTPSTGTFTTVTADFIHAKNLLTTGSFTWDSATASPAAIAGGQSAPVVTEIHKQMRGCLLNDDGTVNYYLDDTNWALKADGTSSVLTGADGNVMIEIPKFFFQVYYSTTKPEWRISPTPTAGFDVHPAFIKDGVEVDYRYYSAYDGGVFDASASAYIGGLNLDNNSGNVDTAADKLASVKDVFPMVGLTRNEFRLLAENVGAGWRQVDFTLWSAVQMLFLIEHQSFSSQSILGAGNTNGGYIGSSANQNDSPNTIAGAGDAIANGSTDTTSGAGVNAKPGTSFMKYRGIENYFGNVFYWTDGINVNVSANGNVHVTNNRADFADNTSANMELITSSLPTASGFIRDLLQLDGYFLSSNNSGGSSTTFVTDQHFASTASNRVVLVGGAANAGADAGVFCLSSNRGSGFRIRNIGGRLAF